jgi:hypothetical protein
MDDLQIRHPMTIKELEGWLATGAPGTWCLYWQGFLPLDKRDERRSWDQGASPAEYNAHNVSAIVWHAAQAGIVKAYQRRVNPGEFRYWAQKQ